MNAIVTTTSTDRNSAIISKWNECSQIAATSAATRTRQIGKFFEWCTETGTAEVTRETVRAYVAYLQGSTAAGRRYSESTAAGYYSALRSFSKFLFYEGLAPMDVCNGVKGPKVTNTDHFYKRALLGDEVPAFLDVCRQNLSSRDYAIVYLMLKNGLRCVEVSRLRVCDIAGSLYGAHVIQIFGKGCTEASQTARLDEPVFRMLSEYVASTGRKVSEADQSPLFQSRKGAAALETRTISRICREALNAAGYDSSEFTAHSLRHTFCTAVYSVSGGDLSRTQRAARHKNGRVTARYIWEAQNQDDIVNAVKLNY